jgi:uroporphyrin-III C-methyltransferase / precorrin-2 dehydrogenase / sirohydrochlorin ferrochelatase
MKPQRNAKPQSSESRIGDLSVLPVFLDLQGKKAVAFGATDGLLWKADLLLSAGASLTLVVSEPTADVLNLVSQRPQAKLLVSPGSECGVTKADIIIADICEEDAGAFFQWALTITDFVNLVDKSEFCRFQFGSIVNHSPVVIGISTAGAAPVLAQKLRTLIESVLPSGLSALASRAQSIRPRVNVRIATPALRRKYWHAYFGRLFGRDQKAGANVAYVIRIASVQDLTLRDIQHLQSATTVFIDSAVDPLAHIYIRREAKCITTAHQAPPDASHPGTVWLLSQ